MNRTFLLFAIPALLACAGCSFRGPDTRFYSLAAGGEAAVEGEPFGLTLRVGRFTASSRYGIRMAERLSDVEVRYREFHRWTEAPEELVSDAFYRELARGGLFAYVIPPDFDGRADLLLEGRVVEMEKDADGNAALRLALALRRQADRSTVWQNTICRSVQPEDRTPPAFARALAEALREIVAQCVEDWQGLPLRSAGAG